MRSFLSIPEFPAPSVIGKKVEAALAELSDRQISVRLLSQKEDNDLEPGTIISQIPNPGQMVKPRQTIFLTISYQKEPPKAPLMVGKKIEACQAELQHAHIRFKIMYQHHTNYPSGTCIAQIPAPETALHPSGMILYVAQSHQKPIVWPRLIGLPLSQVIDFLETSAITPHITYSSHPYLVIDDMPILDQRPLAGSLMYIDPEKPPIVELQV